jgi:hypothetical protein
VQLLHEIGLALRLEQLLQLLVGSKWSSIARLAAPVMKTRRRAPAASASSTAYWISGLSTTGSISLGLALVAGRKRVPRPATGNTAVSIGRRLVVMHPPATVVRPA